MAFDSRLLAGIGVLTAVVESGSFVRAGEALGLTPSGVSRAVGRLEGRVGVRLFDRTPRAVTLTDEGRRFHAQVLPLLAGLEEAATDAGGSAAEVRGRLRVNVDPWFARLVLAPRLAGFLDAHPALSVELVVRDTLGELVAEGFDAAVRFGEPEPSGLVARKLLETRILTCASPGYLARNGTPLHPNDLERHACLMFRDSVTGRPFAWEFCRGDEVVAVKVNGRMVLNDLATKLAACAAGCGVAQTIALGVDSLLASGELVQILPDWADERFPLYAYHLSRHLPPAKVRAFLDFVVASVMGSSIRPAGPAVRDAVPATADEGR
ncbi:LysR family transcriptional regulator [Acidisphaera sp. S103]|uniref:LysR family transcriptional regulator n=1 Tax=Acidisphaera sp. S103 TaxID=1747223 RepID=UPI00131C3C3C|nr:LysR family transcriptional regulator [Acidisphaera sp. S103]